MTFTAHNDEGTLGWGVTRDTDEHVVGGPFVRFTEVEARVIAFALDALADGHVLVERWADELGRTCELAYDGPSEVLV